MTLNEITQTRLFSQKIIESPYKSAKEIVSWMGAMQAQDFWMAKWAIGLRLNEVSEKDITEAYNRGDILRTHLMRPTWHFVSPEDIYWMLDLTAPQIKATLKTRQRNLELSEEVIGKSLKIIEGILYHQKNCTREELNHEFNKEKIRTDENRLSHLLLTAELEKLICSGPVRGNKITWSLLDERVPQKKTYTREESLAKLAKRYFSSHYPATIKDFSRWSGLSLKDSGRGLESEKDKFRSEQTGLETYWVPASLNFTDNQYIYAVFLLPAYDEFLIGYQSRIAALSLIEQKKVVSSNGIFWPTIIMNGQVVGIWKKSIKNQRMMFVGELLQKDKRIIVMIEEKIRRLSKFLDTEIMSELRYMNEIPR
jgi:hypothetical protein